MPHDARQARDQWPRFELVTFSEPTGIPHGWDNSVVSKGVPKDLLGAYHAAKELALLEVPGEGGFVCFGNCGGDDSICLDPRSGSVVWIGYVATDTINQASGIQGPPTLVNSSLDQFISSVHAVVNRFPFDNGRPEQGQGQGHDRDDQANQWEPVAEELFETLRGIDPAAMADLDGFWMTFVSDVQMGDYSTKRVLDDLAE